jgi:hypothetical protein
VGDLRLEASVFLFAILCCSSGGNHSKEYLAKFGDIQNMKVEKVLHTPSISYGRQLWQFLTNLKIFIFGPFFFP